MKRLTSILGYTAAGLTILASVLVPFLLTPAFTRGIAATGVRIDPALTGGDVARTIDKGAYRILVHRSVLRPTPLAHISPFVQLVWTPVAALPGHISEQVDIDGDGRPDLGVSFDVPQNPATPLYMDVAALNPRFQSLRHAGKISFSCVIARVNDTVLIRVPLAKP